MFLTNFIFVFSLLKMHPAVDLNTSKSLTLLQWKKKFTKSLLAFANLVILIF